MSVTMNKHTITAFFDSRDEADAAAAQLRASGIAASDVVVSPDNARDELGVRTGVADDAEPRKTGFWASLEELFGGTEDHHTYTEGLRRGGIMLTAHIEDAKLDRTVEILEQHGSIDLDEREETWRSEGWRSEGSTGGAAAAAMSTPVMDRNATALAMTETTAPTRVVETETRTTAAAARDSAMLARTAVAAGNGDVLQVVEERLDVGKRAVSRGKVRLHSYVVETAVSEDVTLRDETLTIDRHAVDRPVAALGADAFRERTIEMEQIGEEAVVAKSARVVEEIGIRKDATDHVETVRDTLRSTKVDIEDGRTVGTAKTDVLGGHVSRLVKDMDVIGSDGLHVGVIDHIDGDTIKLKRMDPKSGGQHHLIPTAMIASVEDRAAVLSMTAKDAMSRWVAA